MFVAGERILAMKSGMVLKAILLLLGQYHNNVVDDDDDDDDDDTDDVDIYIFARGSISQSCLSQESSG